MLLLRERRQYLTGAQDALAGAEETLVVLAGHLEDPLGPAWREQFRVPFGVRSVR